MFFVVCFKWLFSPSLGIFWYLIGWRVVKERLNSILKLANFFPSGIINNFSQKISSCFIVWIYVFSSCLVRKFGAIILTLVISLDCLTVGDERKELEHNQSSFEWENRKEAPSPRQARLYHVELPALQRGQVTVKSWHMLSEANITLTRISLKNRAHVGG